jgi:hypothetical protein
MKVFPLIIFIFVYFIAKTQTHDVGDQVILVQLELNEKLLIPSYWNSYEIENKRIILHLNDDDPLFDIESIEDDEDKVVNDCFIPNLKLIYKDNTYLISSLCNKIKKFENIKPFVTGEKELPCNLTYSDELSHSLEKYQAIFFGPTYYKDFNAFAQKNSSVIQQPVNNFTQSVSDEEDENEVSNKEVQEDIEKEENELSEDIEVNTGTEMNDEDEGDDEDIEEEEDLDID